MLAYFMLSIYITKSRAANSQSYLPKGSSMELMCNKNFNQCRNNAMINAILLIEATFVFMLRNSDMFVCIINETRGQN